MLDAAVITTSVGLSIVLFLIALLGGAVFLRIRRVRGLRKSRDRRISLAIAGGSNRHSSGLTTSGSRLNEADEYPAIHSYHDVEEGNPQSQNKDRWSSLFNNLAPARQPPLRSLRKAIISGCRSPLSAIIQKSQAWRETTGVVAELPSETTPRNTFENQENVTPVASQTRDSSVTYPQSLNAKSSNKSPVTNTPKLDSESRESPVPGPPPSRPPPSLPPTRVSNRYDTPGRRSTSRGSALSSKTTDTSILDVSANPPFRNVDLHGFPSSSTFHSFKMQRRHGDTSTEGNKQRPQQRAKFGRYASWTSPDFRYNGWEQYPSSKDMTSRGQSRVRASHALVPSTRPADKIVSSHPPMLSKMAEQRKHRSLVTDSLTRCENCRAITPEPGARTQESQGNAESEAQEHPTSRTPTSQPIKEKTKPKPKISKNKLMEQNSKTSGFPVVTPTAPPSRIPSPTRPCKKSKERWPTLPSNQDPCKTSTPSSREIVGAEFPLDDLFTSTKQGSASSVCPPMKREEVHIPRSQLREGSKVTPTAVSPFAELTSLFPHQRSGVSLSPWCTLQEPFSTQEKSASYPPSICWRPIRPITPSQSVDDLRKSIMKLRRMNSEARGRSRSLYVYLQSSELPDNTMNIANPQHTKDSHNRKMAELNANDGNPKCRTDAAIAKNWKDMAVSPRKSTSLGSNKTTEGSVWEDASLPNSFGATSFLSGRVSLEWAPRNEMDNHAPTHASGTTLNRKTGSRRKDDLAGMNFVTPGSLYDSNGFLKE